VQWFQEKVFVLLSAGMFKVDSREKRPLARIGIFAVIA
jgi:hypothetical protein